MSDEIMPLDLTQLRRAFEVATSSRANGNHPFGAVLVAASGQVLLEAENTVVRTGDLTGRERCHPICEHRALLDVRHRGAMGWGSDELSSACPKAACETSTTKVRPKPPNDFSCREVFAFSH